MTAAASMRTFGISRRTALAALCTSFAALRTIKLCFGQERIVGKATDLKSIAAKFSIEIQTEAAFPIKTTHGFIHGRSAGSDSLASYEGLFAREFSRYPVSFVKASKLKKVVLCEDLSFAGQRRNAVPDFEHDALYLDAKRGDYNSVYQCKVIHHEFFHIVDYVDDGKLYEDESWTKLNAADFRYGTGGRNAQDNASTSVLTDLYPGFLNHYSTTGIEEDKAEIFANMIVAPQHVQSQAMRDPVLGRKVAAMKTLLLRFCADVNDEFWATIEQAK